MRRALVTGGNSPIGAAICRRLAADGLSVLVHGRDAERAEAVASAIRDAGGAASAVCFDVADGEASAAALAEVLRDGPVQVVVHNAGSHDDAPLAGMREAQWRGVVDTSLFGFFAVLRPLLLPMIGTRWGRVVAISSVSGVMGNRGQANYAAAKAGLIGAVKSVSLEYASRGVTANAVAPGIIASPAVERAGLDAARIAQLVPARRAGTPEEVAAVVGFLCSEAAGYVSGQCVSVNGGMA